MTDSTLICEGNFELVSDYAPKGDQPQAIKQLVNGLNSNLKHQVLLGVTGSGKTFTMANVIAQVNRPTLVIAHNKTLAAQLYREFKELFPNNAVEYFVSYYDYYQPEAYLPSTDTYIEKDSSVNEEIDKMRHSATVSILTRRDVIVVASVSCIYGIGAPETYLGMHLFLENNMNYPRNQLLKKLVEIQYERNDLDFFRGTFRVRGDVVDIYPSNEEKKAIRIEYFGDSIESICEIDPLKGTTINKLQKVIIFPGSHYVTPENDLERAIKQIKTELQERLEELTSQNKLLEAQRLEQRTNYDLEMLSETGFCTGIENYSRHLTGRAAGEHPPVLLDYFPKDFLLFIDESHATIPQIRGMFNGDRSRKETLVEYGFRLPSALDNRPLRFDEFCDYINFAIYVSATPADYELEKSRGVVIQQIIRPTGLIDPEIEVKPATNQVDDLFDEIKKRTEKKERVMITSLTKRMAENLCDYYSELGIKVRYLHSDIDTIERVRIIRDLRKGEFDVLVGVNLLREGLDIPEVSLVAILDADKEGFLRAEKSLIQTCGRAARNVNGKVILYADRITKSMKKTIDETNRRRTIQLEFNRKNNITPKSIVKSISNILESVYEKDYVDVPIVSDEEEKYLSEKDIKEKIEQLKSEMMDAAKNLQFEKAAELRDRMFELEQFELNFLK